MDILLFILGLVYAQLGSYADTVNRTTDDSLGDSVTHLLVTYLPEAGVWQNQACTTCPIQPDLSQTFSGTYTAATHMPGQSPISITMDFTGQSFSDDLLTSIAHFFQELPFGFTLHWPILFHEQLL